MLIRSGEARLVGWSRSTLYSGFNILPHSVIRRQTGFAARITRTLYRFRRKHRHDRWRSRHVRHALASVLGVLVRVRDMLAALHFILATCSVAARWSALDSRFARKHAGLRQGSTIQWWFKHQQLTHGKRGITMRCTRSTHSGGREVVRFPFVPGDR